MLIVEAPRLKSAHLVEDCSALGLNKVWVPTYSARCKVNQAFANNLIAHLHGHHLHRHDSHMIARKAVVEDLEEGPHICFKEALLHIAVVACRGTNQGREQCGALSTSAYDSAGWSDLYILSETMRTTFAAAGPE